MGKVHEDAKKVLKNLDVMILGIKAKGGYKERKQFQMSDRELDLFLADCEDRLRKIVVHLVVAETMMQEPAPSIHSRWEEYARRRTECMAQLGKK